MVWDEHYDEVLLTVNGLFQITNPKHDLRTELWDSPHVVTGVSENLMFGVSVW